MKRKSITRFICALMILLLVLVSLPLSAIATDTVGPSASYSGTYDMFLDFEKLNVGDNLTTEVLNTLVSPYSAARVSDSALLEAMADPNNSGNTVVGNVGNDFCFYIKEGTDIRLPATDFVISGDFRFSEFPTEVDSGADAFVPLFSWLIGNSSSPKYLIFCRLDSDGNLLDSAKKTMGVTFGLNEWYNVAIHCDGATAEYDIYVDGEYVGSGDAGEPVSAGPRSDIRVLISGQNSKYGVMLDDIQLYEQTKSARATNVNDVIWNIDFENFSEDVKLTENDINNMSDVADLGTNHTAWSKRGLIVSKNKSKMIKISNSTTDEQLDLCVGDADYDPLKNGTVKLAFDINVENFGKSFIYLARWMRRNTSGINNSSNRKTVNILNLQSDDGETGYLVFNGTDTKYAINKNVNYRIELIFNNRIIDNVPYCDVSLNVDDGKGFVTVVDSSIGWGSTDIMAEDYAYFLDDANNKHYLPYFGCAKFFRYDYDGNQITNADGTYAFADKLVTITNTLPDTFRMFQGKDTSSATKDFTYYVDNLKIEKIDDAPIIDFSFDGWKELGLSGDTSNASNNRLKLNNASIVKDEDGNSYAELPATASKHILVADPYAHFMGKNSEFSYDVYFPKKSDAKVEPSSFIYFLYQTKSDNPFAGVTASGMYEILVIRADGDGNIYRKNGEQNEFLGTLKAGEWNNITFKFSGDGEYWNQLTMYIGGEMVHMRAMSASAQEKAKSYCFRLTSIENVAIGIDNIFLGESEEVKTPISIGFESSSEYADAMGRLGADWQMGIIGSERAAILGEEGSKYLRVNHEGLKESQNAYLDVKNEDFFEDEQYLIETSIRYTSKTAFNLTVAEVYRAQEAKSAPLLNVRGNSNKMYVMIRGLQYDIVDSSGNVIYVSKTSDKSFTDVAILIDDANETYTLYINGDLAYYAYEKQVLPCVDVPMHFLDILTTTDVSADLVRLLEIPSVKMAESVSDIKYINVRSLSNGVGVNGKGAQIRENIKKNNFDLRFLAGIDSLYGNKIGFEISVDYEDYDGSHTKKIDKSSQNVFERINAAGLDVSAQELYSKYIVAVEVLEIPNDVKATFHVEPYVLRGSIKVYGEGYTVAFENGIEVK